MKASRSNSSGFTLIELMVVMGIIVLIIGMGVASMGSVGEERKLAEPMAKVREFAKRARNQAILEQRPYQIVISPQAITIQSAVSASPNGGSPVGDGNARPRGQIDKFSWDDDVVMTVRRWNQKEFAEPGQHLWVFERSGLCEPLQIRASTNRGYIQMTFNPLDAHVEEKASEIK